MTTAGYGAMLPRVADGHVSLLDNQSPEQDITDLQSESPAGAIPHLPFSTESFAYLVEFELIELPAEVPAPEHAFDGVDDVKKTKRGSLSDGLRSIKASEQAFGVVLMVAGVISFAILPVCYQGLPVKSPWIRTVWWYSVTFMTTFPHWIHHITHLTQEQKDAYRTFEGLFSLVATMVATTVWFVSWSMALQITSLTHVVLFSQMHPLIFVFMKAVGRRRLPEFGEGMGVLAGYAGAMLCLLGHSTNNHTKDATLGGDLVALASTLAIVVYISSGKKLGKHNLPAIAVQFPFVVQQLIAGVALSYTFDEPEWSRDPTTGFFGWLSSPGACAVTILLGMCSYVGLQSYTTAMKSVPAIIASCGMLVEPVISTVAGIMVGVAGVPSVWTQAGGVLVLAGVGMVIAVSKREETAGKRVEAVVAGEDLGDVEMRPVSV